MLYVKERAEPATPVNVKVIADWVSTDGKNTRHATFELPNGDPLSVQLPIGAVGSTLTLWHRTGNNTYYWQDPNAGGVK